MRLGIDSFSLRWQDWDAFKILDYAASLGLDNVHFSERAHLGGTDRARLESVRDAAAELGLTVEVGMRSFNCVSGTFDPSLGSGEQQLIDMLDVARVIGSPVVRCFAGMQSDRIGPGGFAAFFDESVRTMRAAAPHAEAAGIAIAVENHGFGDYLAPELRDMIEAVGSPMVRVCLDTGNPGYAAEDAVYATEVLAPYTVTAHIRDTLAWLTPDGAMVQWVPAGRGSVDIGKIVAILKSTGRDIPLDLEVITGGSPRLIPIYDPDSEHWRMYPEMRAISLARFLATARDSEAGPIDQLVPPPGMPGPPPDQLEEFRAQQRDHFEESVRHCRSIVQATP
jgi:sugar phosphate isomerase/epimerase